MTPPPKSSGLGGIVMRELASQTTHMLPARARQSKRHQKLKSCREKAPGHVPDSEKLYFLKKDQAARALAALSLTWAPHAGIAAGLHPKSAEAQEVAAIKAREWASVEARTLWQAKAAWQSWAIFAQARGYADTSKAPASLVTIWMNSKGTTSGAQTLYRGLHWVVVHAAAPAQLNKTMKPMAPRCKRLATKKQAAVAEPAMIQQLERAILAASAIDHWTTPSLCTAHIMATGVVRFAHTKRSAFMLKKTGGWWCKCFLGKCGAEQGKRREYVWFAPAVNLTGMAQSPIEILHKLWDRASRNLGRPITYLAFEAHTGAEVSYGRFQDILRAAVSPIIPAEQARWVVTYSLRRVGATLTQLFNLNGKKEHALGGWSITGASRDACDVRRSMPLLYNGRRGEMEETTKLAVWRALITLVRRARTTTLRPTWEDIAVQATEHSSKGTACEQLLLKEEHAAARQVEATYLELAFGVTEETLANRRFSIIAERNSGKRRSEEQAALARQADRGKKPRWKHAGIIPNLLREIELDQMLRDGGADLSNSPPPPTAHPQQRPPKRDPKVNCGEQCRCMTACGSSSCCGGNASCCRGDEKHGERHYCSTCIGPGLAAESLARAARIACNPGSELAVTAVRDAGTTGKLTAPTPFCCPAWYIAMFSGARKFEDTFEAFTAKNANRASSQLCTISARLGALVVRGMPQRPFTQVTGHPGPKGPMCNNVCTPKVSRKCKPHGNGCSLERGHDSQHMCWPCRRWTINNPLESTPAMTCPTPSARGRVQG